MLNPDRVSPHSIDAEKAVLGAMIVDQDTILPVTDILKEQDFYIEGHKKVFLAIEKLFNNHQPVDMLSLVEKLTEMREIEKVGGINYIATLLDSIPAATNAEYYARIVREKASKRELILLGQRIFSLGYQQQTANELIGEAGRLFNKILTEDNTSSGVTSNELFESIKEKIPKELTFLIGVPTGFQDMDYLLGGYIPKQLILIAGRPGMGKTAFVLNSLVASARKCAEEELPGQWIFYSLEQSIDQLALRCTSMLYGKAKSVLDLRRGNLSAEERRDVFNVIDNLKDLPVMWFEEKDNSIQHFLRKSRKAAREQKILGIIIDHVGQMSYQGISDPQHEAFKTVAELQMLAKELNLPIIGLHQLNREVEKRRCKRPVLSDLRQSGNSEQCADLVMGLYRDDYYDKNSAKPGILEVEILKARDGALGTIELVFNKRTLQIFDKTGRC